MIENSIIKDLMVLLNFLNETNETSANDINSQNDTVDSEEYDVDTSSVIIPDTITRDAVEASLRNVEETIEVLSRTVQTVKQILEVNK